MPVTQSLEQFKRISTFKVSPTARYVASMVRIANTLSITVLMEITGLPRSTIYRALSEVNDAVPEGCGSLIEYNCLTDGTETKNICLTDETANENHKNPHIEERARLKETPSELSSTEEKIDPPLTPPSPVQSRSWEDDVASQTASHPTITVENGKAVLHNGTRAEWLARFGGDEEDLELALIDAVGTIQPNSRQDPAMQITRRLSIIVRDRREKDKRYAAAVASSRKAAAKPAAKLSRW